MGLANSRIKQECEELQFNSNCEQITVKSLNEDKTFFEGQITGAVGTPYENCTFGFTVSILDYPFSPPTVIFTSKTWHPNICPLTGRMILDDWSPSHTLMELLKSVQSLFQKPEFSAHANQTASEQMSVSKCTFDETARISALFHAFEEGNQSAANPYREEYDRAVSKTYRDFSFNRPSKITREHANHLDPMALRHFWATSPPPAGSSRILPVPPDSVEHAFVLARFSESLPAAALRAVWRVENPGQLDAFEARARGLAWACGGAPDMVRWLFHGTDERSAARIASDPVVGFRPALARRAVHGHGVYFAAEARISEQYTRDGAMILAAVAVGRSARGAAGAAAPPPRHHSLTDGDRIFALQVPGPRASRKPLRRTRPAGPGLTV